MAAIIIGLIAGGIWMAGPNRQEKQVAALSARVNSLESELRALADQAKKNALDPEKIAALDRRLSAAEQAVRQAAEIPDRLRQNEQALAGLRELPERLAAAEQNATSLRGIDARLAKLERTLADAPASGSDPALNERVKGAEASMQSLVEQVQALAGRIDRLATVTRDVSQQAASNEQAAVQSAGSDRALRYAFAANALRAAIERGAPFADELGVVKRFATNGGDLEPLEALAGTGVPNAAGLSREFSLLTRDMLAAAGRPPREEGIFDRLQARAERLVRIRTVNEVAGDDPTAVVARIEGQLGRGDVGSALAEFDKLPEAVRQPAEDWRKKAKQRLQAIEIGRYLSQRAVGALGEPPQ